MDTTSTKTSSTKLKSRLHLPHHGPARVPPLVNGDHLSRAEFERRYEAMTQLKGAELIEGRVYMPSPVRYGHHSEPHATIVACNFIYATVTPGVRYADGATIRLDLDNEPQPDAFLFIDPKRGGQARIDKDDYIAGAPELIVEVSSSTVSCDLHEKLEAYRRNGVREYIVWRVEDAAVDWFVLSRKRYVRLAADPDGILRSRVFPGFWLDVEALIALETAGVLTTLHRGLASEARADFVRRLAAK